MLKKEKYLSLCVALILFCGAAFAVKADFDGSKPRNQPAYGQPVRLSDSQELEPSAIHWPWSKAKNWTVMVFVNGKNNLERYGVEDLNEMEAVGSSDRVNVVVEFGRLGYYGGEQAWRGHRRYLIKKDSDPSSITSPVVMDIPQADMGDWKHLVEFVKWAKKKYPARHYMLIVWDHGSGWQLQDYSKEFTPKGISYDDETGNHITTVQLGQAMAELGKIDVYGSDACLMQMASIGYEMRKHVNVIVGSEETEPGEGYDYTAFLTPLVANPAASPAELGKYAVEAYRDFYARKGEAITQSAIKAAALPKLLSLLNAWIDIVMKANEMNLVKTAKENAAHFYLSDSRDLYHFIGLMAEGTSQPVIARKGRELMDYIQNKLVIANGVTGSYTEVAHGLAIYMPQSSYSTAYDNLAWARDGKWDDFMRWSLGTKVANSDY